MGLYSRLYSWVSDKNSGLNIDSTRMDAETDGIVSNLNGKVDKDGTVAMTGALAMGSNKITGLANGTASTDAATVGQIQSGSDYALDTSASANTFTIPLSPAWTSYTTGAGLWFKAANTNTGASVANVNGLGDKAVKKRHDVDLASGDVEAGGIYGLRYDGTYLQLISVSSAAVDTADTQTLTNKTIDADNNTISNIAIGAECTGASTDLTDTADLTYNADTDVSGNGWVVDEDNMSSNLATKVPTQQSVKAYVDSSSGITADTVQATTSGSTPKDFTIASGAKRITILFDSVSLSGTDDLLIQVGPSSTPVTTGYVSTSAAGTGSTSNSTSGFIMRLSVATRTVSGSMTLFNITGNTWVQSHETKSTTDNVAHGGGDIDLAGELDIVRVGISGSDNWDGGQVNVFVE